VKIDDRQSGDVREQLVEHGVGLNDGLAGNRSQVSLGERKIDRRQTWRKSKGAKRFMAGHLATTEGLARQ
jgi:hypothetical protein